MPPELRIWFSKYGRVCRSSKDVKRQSDLAAALPLVHHDATSGIARPSSIPTYSATPGSRSCTTDEVTESIAHSSATSPCTSNASSSNCEDLSPLRVFKGPWVFGLSRNRVSLENLTLPFSLADFSSDEDSAARDDSLLSATSGSDSHPRCVAQLKDDDDDAYSEIVEEFKREFRTHSTRLMLLQAFSAGDGAGSRRINPVFHCWSDPELISKIDTLTPEIQRKFYERLDEELNLTEEAPSDELVSSILDRVLRENPRPKARIPPPPSIPRVEELDAGPSGDTQPQETPQADSRPADVYGSEYDGDDTEDLQSEVSIEGSDIVNESQEDDDEEGQRILPRQKDDRFEGRPFLIKKGELSEVLERYLAVKDHYRLEHGYTFQKLKSRKTCHLECRRSVARRHRGKTASAHNPDWRLWPSFQCPMSEVLVKCLGELVCFYGLKEARAGTEAWASHSHPAGTWRCHSSFVPPDIIDDWCYWVDEEPGIGLEQLEDRTYRKQRDYCAETIRFLVQRELNQHDKTRGAYRSIKENGKEGLSIHSFLRQLAPITVSSSELAAKVRPILSALAAVEAHEATDEQAELALRVDDCILLEDVLCTHEKGPEGKRVLSEFSAVLTSARMLRNMTNVKTIGLDATFNLLYADVVIGVVCQLSPRDAAKPIALAVMRREATGSVRHLLEQIQRAAETLQLANCIPLEAVMDGSDALHRATIEVYGSSTIILSCYFHVIKNARELKARHNIPGYIWREILLDLETVADSWNRAEWEGTVNLFNKKWKEDTQQRSLSNTVKASIAGLMADFADYLNPEHWRSYWGAYGGQHSGPRTNNSVERFNKQLKTDLIPGRNRITLSEFAAVVKKPGAWTRVSQYGKLDTRGKPTSELRRKAAELYIRNSFCQVPRSWDSTHGGVVTVQWLFAASQANLRDIVHSSSNTDLRRFCGGRYQSLEDAQNLKRSYAIVAYQKTPDIGVPAPEGPFCTCKSWVKTLICPHVICISYCMGKDNTREALRDWATILVNFPKPRQRRDKRGRIEEQAIPSTVRYGLTKANRPKGREQVEQSQPSTATADIIPEDTHLPGSPESEEVREARVEAHDTAEPAMASQHGSQTSQRDATNYRNITWPIHPEVDDQSVYCGLVEDTTPLLR
ncbi:hypothetical protein FOZ62_010846 [Perkinsus olseni]|uniref:SWIM-type domain-containing protein n=2 Tax=Perkinsus olseni TaxID=32597 RepID=A0A7J6PLA3_PEROL|nr:hypothetical protein FOZ62_010846 [Perkinsus olseni]